MPTQSAACSDRRWSDGQASAVVAPRTFDVIVADGVIEAQTPEAFVNFLKSGSSDFKLRRIVFRRASLMSHAVI